MLQTQFFEKEMHSLQWRKAFGLLFLAISSVKKPYETFYERPRGILTITVEVTGLFLLHLRSCWKHNFLKRKMQTFEWKKKFGPFFLALSSVINLRKLFLGIHNVFWQLLWKLQDHFWNTYKVDENTNFGKKNANFPVKKRFWPTFSRIIE